MSHQRTVYYFSKQSYDNKNNYSGKSHESCGERYCFSYCSWPPVQQKSRLLIGLNRILFCFNDSSQITKNFLCMIAFFHNVSFLFAAADELDLAEYRVHVIASVLKLFFRQLPKPLVPDEFYNDFIRSVGKIF